MWLRIARFRVSSELSVCTCYIFEIFNSCYNICNVFFYYGENVLRKENHPHTNIRIGGAGQQSINTSLKKDSATENLLDF